MYSRSEVNKDFFYADISFRVGLLAPFGSSSLGTT